MNLAAQHFFPGPTPQPRPSLGLPQSPIHHRNLGGDLRPPAWIPASAPSPARSPASSSLSPARGRRIRCRVATSGLRQSRRRRPGDRASGALSAWMWAGDSCPLLRKLPQPQARSWHAGLPDKSLISLGVLKSCLL